MGVDALNLSQLIRRYLTWPFRRDGVCVCGRVEIGLMHGFTYCGYSVVVDALDRLRYWGGMSIHLSLGLNQYMVLVD